MISKMTLQECNPLHSINNKKAANIILISFIIGMVLRALMSIFLTYSEDFNYWIATSENIVSGDGLYDMPGYYYSPVWGMVLSICATLASMLGIQFGYFDTTRIPCEYPGTVFQAVPDLGFALLLKSVLIVVDILVGYFIYKIAMEISNDEVKGAKSFAIWFLCPLTILISSERVMFENIEILFMLMSFYAILKKQPYLAGILMATSILTKPFGAFLAVLLITYSYTSTHDRSFTFKYIISTGLMGLFLMMPTIMSGDVAASFIWLTERMGGSFSDYVTVTLNLMPLSIVMTFFLSWRIYKHDCSDPQEPLLMALLCLTISIVLGGHVQYYLMLLPILAIIIDYDYDNIMKWAVISLSLLGIGYTFRMGEAIINTYVYTGMVGCGALESFVTSLNDNVLFLITSIARMMAFVTLSVVSIFCLVEKHITNKGSNEKHSV